MGISQTFSKKKREKKSKYFVGGVREMKKEKGKEEGEKQGAQCLFHMIRKNNGRSMP